MTNEPTPQQIRRRRRAAIELRSRAADLLDQAARLDGDPALRILESDIERIAAYIGVRTDDLVVAVTALWRHPDNEDTTTTEGNEPS